jgi:hypothetical protein
MTFSSLEQALHAGFQVRDRTERGYLVRMRTAAGWLRATVNVGAAGLREADAQHGDVIDGGAATVSPGRSEDARRRVVDTRVDRRERAP